MNAIAKLYTDLVTLIPFEPVRNGINLIIPALSIASLVLFTVFILIWWE